MRWRREPEPFIPPPRMVLPGWVTSAGQLAPLVMLAVITFVSGQLWEMKLQQTKMIEKIEMLCAQAVAREESDTENARINARQDQQIQRLLIRTGLER